MIFRLIIQILTESSSESSNSVERSNKTNNNITQQNDKENSLKDFLSRINSLSNPIINMQKIFMDFEKQFDQNAPESANSFYKMSQKEVFEKTLDKDGKPKIIHKIDRKTNDNGHEQEVIKVDDGGNEAKKLFNMQ